MIDFKMKLNELFTLYNIKKIDPVNDESIKITLDSLGPVPDDLYKLYKLTNGLAFEWFKIFPIEDKNNIKRTWESIQKANNIDKSSYLSNDKNLFKRFVIIANISGGNCAVIDKNDFTIWYEEDGLHQTDLSLIEFIELTLKEVFELNG